MNETCNNLVNKTDDTFNNLMKQYEAKMDASESIKKEKKTLYERKHYHEHILHDINNNIDILNRTLRNTENELDEIKNMIKPLWCELYPFVWVYQISSSKYGNFIWVYTNKEDFEKTINSIIILADIQPTIKYYDNKVDIERIFNSIIFQDNMWYPNDMEIMMECFKNHFKL